MVAVKVINVLKMDQKKIENALNEVRIICAIEHPNVVGYEDAFIDEVNKDLYIVMEYLGGGDLNDRINGLVKKKAYLREKRVWRYAVQVLQGLKSLHDKKIIHRDIKPGNVFVSEDLETLKLGDLNVSKIMREREMTQTVIGTPYYLPPEIWKNQEYDYRCDVFSFGCVLYELTALRVPFQAKNIRDLFHKIQFAALPKLPRGYSLDLYRFIKFCLTKEIRNRPTVDVLLCHPLIVSRRHLFEDIWVTRDESLKGRKGKKGRKKGRKRGVRTRKTSGEGVLEMRVETQDLSKLSRMLPSLKNSRSSSAKVFKFGSSVGLLKAKASRKNLDRERRVREKESGPSEASGQDMEAETDDIRQRWGLGENTQSGHVPDMVNKNNKNDKTNRNNKNNKTNKTNKTNKSNKSNSHYGNEDLRQKRVLKKSERQKGDFQRHSNHPSDQKTFFIQKGEPGKSVKTPYDFSSVSSSVMARRKARMSVQNSCKRRVGRKVISQRGSRKALNNRSQFKGKEFLKVKTKGVVENPARLNYIKQVKEKHRRRDEIQNEECPDSRDISLKSKGRTLPHRKNRAKSPKHEVVVPNFENLVGSTVNTPSHSFLKPETPSRSWKRSDVGEDSSVLREKGLLITPRSKRTKKTCEQPSSRFESEHEMSYSKRPKEQTVLSSSQRAKDFESTPNSMRYSDQVARSTKLGGTSEKKPGKRKRKSGTGQRDTNSGGLVAQSQSHRQGAMQHLKDGGKKKRKSANIKTRKSESGVTGGYEASTDIRDDCLEQTGEISLSEGSGNEKIIEIEIMEEMEEDSMDEGCCNISKHSDALETKSKPTSKRMAERPSEEKCPRRIRKSRSHSFVKDAIDPKAKISKSKVLQSKREKSNSRKPPSINETDTGKKKTKTFYLRPPKIAPRQIQNKISKNSRPKIYNRNGQSETGSSESQRTSKRGSKKSKVFKTRRSKFRPRPPLKEGGGKGRLVERSYFQMSTNFEKELPGKLGSKGTNGPKSRSKSESKHVSQRKLASARRVGTYVAEKSFVMPGKRETAPGVDKHEHEGVKEIKKPKRQNRVINTPNTNKAQVAVGRKKKKASAKSKTEKARAKRARNLKLVPKNKTPKKKSSFARSERAMPRFRNLKVRRASSRKGGSVEYKVKAKFGSRLAASQIVGGRKTEKRAKETVERRFLSQIETLEESEGSGIKLEKAKPKDLDTLRQREIRKFREMKGRAKTKIRIVPNEGTEKEKREERLRRKSQLQAEGVYAAIEEMPEQEMNTERTGLTTNSLVPLPRAIPAEIISEENPILNSGLFLSKKEMTQNPDSGSFGFGMLKPGMRLKKLKALKHPRELKSFEEKGEEQASTCKLNEKKNWTAADEKKKTIGKKGSARKIEGAGKGGGNMGGIRSKRTRVSRSRKVDSKFHSQGKTFVHLRSQAGSGLKTGLESSLRAPLVKRQKPSVYKRKRPQNARNPPSGRKDASKSQILERGYLYGRKLKKSSRVNSRVNIRTSHVVPVEGARSPAINFQNSESNNTSKRRGNNSVTLQTESGIQKKRAANGLNFILNPVLTENSNEDHRRTIDSIGLPQRQFMQSNKINNSNDEFKATGEHNATIVSKSVQIHAPKNSLANLEKMRSKRKRLSEMGIELRSPQRGLALREALDHSISIALGLKGTSEGFSADLRPRSQNQSEMNNCVPPKRRKHRRSVKGGAKMVKTANDLGKAEAPSYKSRKVPKARLNSRKPTTGQSVAKRRLRNYGDMLRKKQKYKRKMKEKDRSVSKPAQKVGGKKKRRLRVLGYGSSRVIDKKSQFG